MRLLIDTNVYLEYFLRREKYDDVFAFFHTLYERKNQTCVSAMSLRDIEYVMHKCLKSNELARRLVQQVYQMTSKVVSTSADAAIESIYSEAKDYEDSLQMITAEEAMCDAIITYNKKDFEKSNLPVFTPEEMNEIWLKENR